MTPWSHVLLDARRYHRDLVGGIEPVRALVLADVEQRAALSPDARPVAGSDLAALYHALLTAAELAAKVDEREGHVLVMARREIMGVVMLARWMMAQHEPGAVAPPMPSEGRPYANPGAAMAEVLDGTCTAAGCPIQGWHEEHGPVCSSCGCGGKCLEGKIDPDVVVCALCGCRWCGPEKAREQA